MAVINQILAVVVTAVTLIGPALAGGVAKHDITPEGGNIKSLRYDNDLELYEVAGNDGVIFYLTRNKRYVIMGNVLDAKSMKNITESRKNDLYRIDFSEIPLANAIKIREGNKTKLAVFSTTTCPWCKKLVEELKKLDDVSVYMLLTPFSVNRQNDTGVWCSGNVDTLNRVYNGENIETKKECDTKALDENVELAKKYNINGLPTMVFEDGSRLVGYMPAKMITEKLNHIMEVGGVHK